jgi:O-antigen ligase
LIQIASILIILLHLSEFFVLFQLFAVAGYGFTFTDLMLVIIYSGVLYQFFVKKRKFSFPDFQIIFPIIGLFVAIVLSGFGIFTWGNSNSFIQFFKTFLHFTFISFWGFVLLGAETKTDAYFKMIRVILYSSLVINIYAIYQLFARIYDLPLSYIPITNQQFLNRGFATEYGEISQIVLKFENFYRATSVFSEPSALAFFNVTNLIFIIVPNVMKLKPFVETKWAYNLIRIFVIISLFLTFSMTGLSLIVVFFIALIILTKIKFGKVIVNITFFIILLLFSDLILSNFTKISVLDLFYQRVVGLVVHNKANNMVVGESAPERISSFNNAITLFQESPIFGIGIGNTYNHPKSNARFAQSAFFSFLSETGIVGIFFLFILYFNLIRAGLFLKMNVEKFRYKDEKLASVQSLGIYIAVILVFGTMFISNTIITASFWLLLGVILSAYKATKTSLINESQNILLDNKID